MNGYLAVAITMPVITIPLFMTAIITGNFMFTKVGWIFVVVQLICLVLGATRR